MVRYPRWHSTGQRRRGEEPPPPGTPTTAAAERLAGAVLAVAARDARAGCVEARAFLDSVLPKAGALLDTGMPLLNERGRAGLKR